MHEFQGTVRRGIDLGLRVAGASPPLSPLPPVRLEEKTFKARFRMLLSFES